MRSLFLVSWIGLPLLLACGGEAAMQIVSGRVDPAGFGAVPTSIAAERGARIVAAGPLRDGAFLLALPPGAATRLSLRDAGGALVAYVGDASGDDPIELEICVAGDPLDLGTLLFDETACQPTAACVDASRDLLTCRETADPGACYDCGPSVCADERAAFASCQPTPLRCEEPRHMLEQCLIEAACGHLPDACDELCMAELLRSAELCEACAADSPTAVATPPPQRRIGCER